MVDYRDTPAVYVFGDTAHALADMRASAEGAGCRIVAAQLIAPDAGQPMQAVPGAPILIELEKESAGEAVISLLDRAECEAAAGARRCIVSAPAALIDLLFARAPHPDVELLCGASEDERLAAFSRAVRPTQARFHDTGREDGAWILPEHDDAVGQSAADRDDPAIDAAYVRAMLRARRLRDRYLRGDLFADPAWDMLLDLMAARLEGKKVAVSSLCIAAAVPATTALRWIKLLTERGLFVRVADAVDRRRVHIELSEETARALGTYLRHARRTFPATV